MSDEEIKPTKVATIGIGRQNVSAIVANALEHEKQVRIIETKKRRDLIASLDPEYLNHDVMEQFEKLSRKDLRKYSKEFIFIHDQVKDLGLSHMAKTGRGISSDKIKRVIAALSYISHSKQFSAMSLEDPNTDYFRLVMAVNIATKALPDHFKQNRIPPVLLDRLRFIASEIGIRIYTMYVDRRMDM